VSYEDELDRVLGANRRILEDLEDYARFLEYLHIALQALDRVVKTVGPALANAAGAIVMHGIASELESRHK